MKVSVKCSWCTTSTLVGSEVRGFLAFGSGAGEVFRFDGGDGGHLFFFDDHHDIVFVVNVRNFGTVGFRGTCNNSETYFSLWGNSCLGKEKDRFSIREELQDV